MQVRLCTAFTVLMKCVIGTYETSIQPFEDCCTIFVAKHPVTKPNLNIIKQHEHNLDEVIDDLMKTAIETTEKIIVK